MEIKALSVSQVNNYIKRLLTSDPILYNIYVKGELSNVKLHSSGHMYFTLKDGHSKIPCVMFKSNCEKLETIPEDGDNIIAKGYISLYERDGQYQLYVNEIDMIGIGDLYIAFQQLKNKLEKEGLFEPLKKKNLPLIPRKIGIITSPTGAAIRDILSVIKRRFPKVDLHIFPVSVQGQDAVPSIVKAIKMCNTLKDMEVIILGRGGGSIEELWAFNEEAVARAIHGSEVPIISAVGHETDFTIADFVADLRAPTPSAAGELAVPRQVDVVTTLKALNRRLLFAANKKITEERQRLNIVENNYYFKYPLNFIYDEKQHLDNLYKSLLKVVNQRKLQHREKLEATVERLNSLSPLSVFSRGYAVATTEAGKVIKSITDVNKDEEIKVNLLDGMIDAKVISLTKEDKSLEKNVL
ncbi:exodeoxyribonuclease VII large subunit [Natronincola ferrireducens]|uniref:Exodeoxyribonuclease 7 large subunit n=1 Tax=Natronincola ferrireducens TaxID=393762 RepID=A0A1G9CHC9_9FIRM|nr:exodeoxyribonuclease VII large subunit [Natronincola ferrireducens]SDK51073.1 Exodeoxyribonuclease VII large subunit [Natronincola ferrireducens]